MKRKRHNDDDKEEDRLSDLSDCVLLRILSLLNAKQAVQTCILSTRWNNLWKHLSKLKLHSSYFDTMDGFAEFAAQILSLRGHSTYLYSLKFYGDKPPSNLLSWLKEFTEITSLTVTLTTLEVLSLVPNLLKDKLYSLRNLKSLQVKMEGISSRLSTTPMLARFARLPMIYQEDVAKFREAIFKEGSLSIPDEIVAFLLQNSPSAKYSNTN
ncbi:F-box/FBD/LRR-repeat protein [Trifolium medium]|uniref:F-box/FBD/LRR-repeat protein n=1 Tax=Trifolium medium TaxID=97028 RepID=A0A392MBF1_9FABA|nr:F-box/FBD/LRR-repeat protein [Trifolium medium]